MRAARTIAVALGCLLVGGTAAGAAWPGRPSAPPPRAPTAGAPPPAWLETATASRWLAFGSYCWRTRCVDMLPPAARSDLPRVRAGRGGTVRVHLGFAASSFSLNVDAQPVSARIDAARRVISLRATRPGLLAVSARGTGSASYLIRVQIA